MDTKWDDNFSAASTESRGAQRLIFGEEEGRLGDIGEVCFGRGGWREIKGWGKKTYDLQ